MTPPEDIIVSIEDAAMAKAMHADPNPPTHISGFVPFVARYFALHRQNTERALAEQGK